MAGRALRVAAVTRQQHADVHLVGLGLQPVEEVAHAVPVARPRAVPVLPLRVALEQPLAMLRRQIAHRDVHRHAVFLRHLLEVLLALAIALGLPGLHRAFGQRLGFVRHHQAEIHPDHPPEAATGLAGTDRRVEREQPGRGLGIVDVAVRAMQSGRIAPHRLAQHPLRRRGLHPLARRIHGKPPMTALQRRLQRLGQARILGVRRAEAVLHHLQHVLPLGAGPGEALLDARVTLRGEQAGHLRLAEARRHRHRKAHHQARIALGCRARAQVGGDADRRIAPHRLAAATAVQMRGARVQQLEVVGELGHRAHRRARGAHRVGLVDRDRRRHALDPIHLRLVHAVEELARVGREGLDVAPLALGIQRVEHQRGLARAGHAGHHGQAVQRQVEREVAQVVLARTADADGVGDRGGGVDRGVAGVGGGHGAGG